MDYKGITPPGPCLEVKILDDSSRNFQLVSDLEVFLRRGYSLEEIENALEILKRIEQKS